jgi:16S rRNA (guanine527-N7)-methyltransferase
MAEPMVDASARRDLREAAVRLGLELDEDNWSKIDKTLILLAKYRKAINLTGAGSLVDQAVEALVAVAAANRCAEMGASWLDVGSGGGFPGLVAAAVWRGGVVLTEPRARRAAFLELAVASAGLNAEVRRVRLEGGHLRSFDGDRPLGREFGVASARAVFAPEVWVAEARPWLKSDGICLVHQRETDPPATALGEVRAEASLAGWRVVGLVPRGTSERG